MTHSNLMARPAFRRAVEKLHQLGPRATGELLAEIAEGEECREAVQHHLHRYALLTANMIAAAGGYSMPPVPLHVVAEATCRSSWR